MNNCSSLADVGGLGREGAGSELVLPVGKAASASLG